ncbi:helix-turn-helix transcriptional regulator [Telmatobacter sp. DSM 110680]|uniref:Helix-turn-helix transcriptional regulator n=1 Tax=Telmatobacter sp. DSM 110680 TaxID=3036704 RepID=A0AAU7DEL8_9BACT
MRHNISRMRQAEILREFDPPRGAAVSALAYEYPAGALVPDHAHGSDQLIYAIEGIMEVSSGRSVWTIPPQFALWIPAKAVHRIRMIGEVRMRTLYFRPGVVSRRPPQCSVLYVGLLLRELIVEAVRLRLLRLQNRLERALRDLLSAQLANATAAPIGLTMPSELRALAIAHAIAHNPANLKPLASLCADAGVSVRTIQRIYRREIGIDIDTWRRQVRLTRAVQLLVAGGSVKEVAFAVGYRQSSAFVKAFRRLFGLTPKVWTAGLRSTSGPYGLR